MDCPDDSASSNGALVEALRTEGFVCSLPRRATLFLQGETAQGIHIISRGYIKLSTSSCDGRVLILKVSERGEILPPQLHYWRSLRNDRSNASVGPGKLCEPRAPHARSTQ